MDGIVCHGLVFASGVQGAALGTPTQGESGTFVFSGNR
jgi:hypothetical protein